MSERPYTRADLDAGRCMVEHEHGEQCGASGPLYFHSVCHPSGRLSAVYEAGVITFECGECAALVIKVRVAASSPPPPPPRKIKRPRR